MEFARVLHFLLTVQANNKGSSISKEFFPLNHLVACSISFPYKPL